MPGRRRSRTVTRTVTRTRQRGGKGKFGRKIVKWLGKANGWLRKTKLLSKLGTMYSKTSLPYAANVGKATDVGRTLGYVIRMAGGRRTKGRGLRIAGGMCRR